MTSYKLTLLDRIRGWHWVQNIWWDRYGLYVGTIWSKERNY